MTKTYYFDNPEEGPTPTTSHPIFNQLAPEDFFLDCTDEFSPFGNDDGAEAHYSLEDWYHKQASSAEIVSFMIGYIDDFGFTHECEGFIKELNLEQINWILKEDEFFIGCMDKAIIAFAFGQLKIEGRVNQELKEIGLIALERQKLITLQVYANNELDINKLYRMVDGETTRSNKEGNTNHLEEIYLDRIEIMTRALKQAPI